MVRGRGVDWEKREENEEAWLKRGWGRGRGEGGEAGQ